MTGTDPHQAHVQVLTAEVRTLVIGSRQVTMSVYNQLDTAPPDQIEPFGRVNLSGDDTHWFLFAVGRHATTGALVRSHLPRKPEALDGDGRLRTSPGVHIRYPHWRPDQDAYRQRQQLAETAEQWGALPLIVLAGLR